MASLTELREQLDAVDDEIVKLFEKRMDLCGQVGEYKIQNGRKVFDRQRESEKLKSVESKVSTEFNRKGVHELYEQLMSMSRKLQYQQLVQAGALGDFRLSAFPLSMREMQGSYFRELTGRTVRRPPNTISEKTATVFTCRPSGRRWRRSKRDRLILRCFLLRTLQQEPWMRCTICW